MAEATKGITTIGDKLTILVIAVGAIFVIFIAIKLMNNGRWDEMREGVAKIAISIALALGATRLVDFLLRHLNNVKLIRKEK